MQPYSGVAVGSGLGPKRRQEGAFLCGNRNGLSRQRHPVQPWPPEEGAGRCRALPVGPGSAPAAPRAGSARRTHERGPRPSSTAGFLRPSSSLADMTSPPPPPPPPGGFLPPRPPLLARTAPRRAASRRGAPGVPPCPGDPPRRDGRDAPQPCRATSSRGLSSRRPGPGSPPRTGTRTPQRRRLRNTGVARGFRFRRGQPGCPPPRASPVRGALLCLRAALLRPAASLGRARRRAGAPSPPPAERPGPAAAGGGPGPPARLLGRGGGGGGGGCASPKGAAKPLLLPGLRSDCGGDTGRPPPGRRA